MTVRHSRVHLLVAAAFAAAGFAPGQISAQVGSPRPECADTACRVCPTVAGVVVDVTGRAPFQCAATEV